LLNVVGEKVNVINNENFKYETSIINEHTRIIKTRLTFVVPTTVDLQYEITRKLYETVFDPNGTCHVCKECDFHVSLDVSDVLTPNVSITGFPLNITTVPFQETCGVLNPLKNLYQQNSITFQPGSYNIKITVVKNKESLVGATYLTRLEQQISTIINSLPTREFIINDLFTAKHNEIISTPPTATELLAIYKRNRQDFVNGNYPIQQSQGSSDQICASIQLPEVKLCDDEKICESSTPDFEGYLYEQIGIPKDTKISLSTGGQADISINYFFRDDDDNPKFINTLSDPMPMPFNTNNGFGLFNNIIANMIAESGTCQYDCALIWNTWKAVVGQYVTSVKTDLSKSLNDNITSSKQNVNTTNEHLRVEFRGMSGLMTKKFDLLEVFLNLVGRKLRGKRVLAYNSNDGYLTKPYFYFKDPGSNVIQTCICSRMPQTIPSELTTCTNVSTDWDELYKCVYNDKKNVVISDISSKTDNEFIPNWIKCDPPSSGICDYDSPEWISYFKCIEQYVKEYAVDASINCNEKCESVKSNDYFMSIVLEDFKNNGILNPDSADVACKVSLLRDDCKAGCKLTPQLVTPPGDRGASISTDAEWNEYILRMRMLPEIRTFHNGCPVGFRQLPLGSNVPNVIDLLVTYLN
ncbi:MAG: hypothetical protein JNJ85_03360, partial [Candidatus Kapabacteria bacterium]|nr:hypothetical protein [Candidatus Kapabacteria bacterium]